MNKELCTAIKTIKLKKTNIVCDLKLSEIFLRKLDTHCGFDLHFPSD